MSTNEKSILYSLNDHKKSMKYNSNDREENKNFKRLNYIFQENLSKHKSNGTI